MKVRLYISYKEKEQANGRDEGGYYKLVEQPEPSPKLKKRMSKCAGCYNNFYNGRANVNGNTCWSLKYDENFRGRGKPKCFR